jgi:cation transport ATPase
MVVEAQSREAPVQRLADKVAGWFCYGVMGASAATFGFWSVLGNRCRMLDKFHHFNPMYATLKKKADTTNLRRSSMVS